MDRTSVVSTGIERHLPRTSVTTVSTDNVLKIGVVRQGESNLLMSFEQTKQLATIVQDICQRWNLDNPENFALQMQEQHIYITESNRYDIKQGDILELTSTPGKLVSSMLNNFNSNNPRDKLSALKELEVMSKDLTFAEEFINNDGLNSIIDIIVSGKFEGDPMTHALKSFLQLMEHGIVSWDIIETDFVKKVASMLSFDNQQHLQSCLEVLECVLLNSSRMDSVIEQRLTVQSVGTHLQNQDLTVKKNCLSLINAMLTKADPVKKNKLVDGVRQMPLRQYIVNHVIRDGKVGPAMARQLHVLQCHIFSQIHEKYMKPADPTNSDTMTKLEELLTTGYQLDMDPYHTISRHSHYSKDFRKLGFKNPAKPIEDFMLAPPGILTLDNLVYFAKKQSEAYTKIVLENSVRGDDHDCPIVRASIALTNKLCLILRVGDEPSDEEQTFFSMFFCHEQPFEELFCICMQALNKTWKDMRATVPDFNKVLEVIHEQVSRSLQHPNPSGSFDVFRNKLNSLSYQEIRKLWENERQIQEENTSQAPPIVDLRHQLEPEILKLIKQQRINYLIEGAMFFKYTLTKRGTREKWWYWRLSPNQKAFHFGECEERDINRPIESLHKKLAISDIKDIIVGKDCPHMERERAARKCKLAFAIMTETQENAYFVASDEKQFNIWTDGLNTLIGRPMTSEQKKADMDTLMAMEIRMRLLDIEGIQIPSVAPPIPKPPSNYNFHYKLLT